MRNKHKKLDFINDRMHAAINAEIKTSQSYTKKERYPNKRKYSKQAEIIIDSSVKLK
jgi:hypothetical protein